MKKSDTTQAIGGIALTVLIASMLGCAHTLTGVKQDTATNARKAEVAAHKVGETVKEVPRNLDSATIITPEVKTAIIRDPVLNDPHNHINIDSRDHVTHITGHVESDSMKQRATDDAQVVLTRRHPDYKVSNELTVSSASPS